MADNEAPSLTKDIAGGGGLGRKRGKDSKAVDTVLSFFLFSCKVREEAGGVNL